MLKWLTRSVLALVMITAVMALGARVTHADQRDFTLINGSSSVTIVHVYVSSSGVDDWQEDILGTDVLVPGDSVNIHFSPNDADAGICQYDIRVLGQRGEAGVL